MNNLSSHSSDFFKRVIRNIKRAKNSFALFFIEVNASSQKWNLINELSNNFDLNILVLDAKNLPKNIHIDEWISTQIIDSKADNNQILDAIFLVNFEILFPVLQDEAIPPAISELNWRRNFFRELNVPILFWLPSFALENLAKNANDFYDWYSGVIKYELDGNDLRDMLNQATTGVSTYKNLNKDGKAQEIRNLQNILKESEGSFDKAFANFQLSLLYRALGDYSNAIQYAIDSLPYLEQTGNEVAYATTLNNIGSMYSNVGEFELSLKYLNKSLELRNKNNDTTGMGALFNNLGTLYTKLGQLDDAEKFFNQSLEKERLNKDGIGVASTLTNLGALASRQDKNVLALKYYQEALDVFRSFNDREGISRTLGNIGQSHSGLNDFTSANKFLNEAREINDEIGDRLGNVSVIYNTPRKLDQKFVANKIE